MGAHNKQSRAGRAVRWANLEGTVVDLTDEPYPETLVVELDEIGRTLKVRAGEVEFVEEADQEAAERRVQ